MVADDSVYVNLLTGFQDDDLINELLKECVKMLEINHPNVLTLIGVCVDGGPAPYIVMPFMSNGSLLSHLKKFRNEFFLPANYSDKDEVSKGGYFIISYNRRHKMLVWRSG